LDAEIYISAAAIDRGDYYNYENEKLVGTWCDSISSVEITIEPKDELGYEEVHPDFCY